MLKTNKAFNVGCAVQSVTNSTFLKAYAHHHNAFIQILVRFNPHPTCYLLFYGTYECLQIIRQCSNILIVKKAKARKTMLNKQLKNTDELLKKVDQCKTSSVNEVSSFGFTSFKRYLIAWPSGFRNFVSSRNEFPPFSRFAFTLAEVLITLGIIGVVAAMTIPTLINNSKEAETLTKFKKVYTSLSQAYLSSAQENGTIKTWATSQDVYNNFKPYLKIIEDCPLTKGCFPDTNYKTFKGNTVGNGAYNFYDHTDYYKVRLADGSCLLFGGDLFTAIYVDLNGNKEPNQWGHDMFTFELIDKSGAPVVTGHTPDWANENFCSQSGDATGWIDGGSCATWIIKNANMDYLQRDISHAEWVK